MSTCERYFTYLSFFLFTKMVSLDVLNSNMMCARDNGKDACQGDSGMYVWALKSITKEGALTNSLLFLKHL